MALYRKYRPAMFSEVIGQQHVTEPLARAIDSGRINHAYLFSGPRGCGKTSSARILARSLNCVHGPTSTPCGQCDSCRELGPGGTGNLDVVELDAASHGGVDDTRDLRDRAFYAPSQSRYRVFIIDEAHMVSTAGFNALLKVVEEPPEHVIFIFATTEPEKVIPTIRSRTHHYPFRLLGPTSIRQVIDHVISHENIVIEDEVYPILYRAGGGSPRDTLSILDQLIAGSESNTITSSSASSLLGITDRSLIDTTIKALADKDAQRTYQSIEHILESGHDPKRFIADLLERYRDLLLIQSIPDAIERGIVHQSKESADQLRELARTITNTELIHNTHTLTEAISQFRGATSPQLLVEITIAKLLVTTSQVSLLTEKVHALERIIGEGGIGEHGITPPIRTVDTTTTEQKTPADNVRQMFSRPPATAEETTPHPPEPEENPSNSPSPSASANTPGSDNTPNRGPLPENENPSGSDNSSYPTPSHSDTTIKFHRKSQTPTATTTTTPQTPAHSGLGSPSTSVLKPHEIRAQAAQRRQLQANQNSGSTPTHPPEGTPDHTGTPPEPTPPAENHNNTTAADTTDEKTPPTSPAAEESTEQTLTPAAEGSSQNVLTTEQAYRVWPKIRETVQQLDRILPAMLAGADVIRVDMHGDTPTIVLSHTSPPLIARLNSDRGKKVLCKAAEQVLGYSADVHVEAQGGENSAGGAHPKDPAGGKPATVTSRRRVYEPPRNTAVPSPVPPADTPQPSRHQEPPPPPDQGSIDPIEQRNKAVELVTTILGARRIK